MRNAKLKRTWLGMAFTAVIAISIVAFADEGAIHMPIHKWPFVSGVSAAGQSSVPGGETSGKHVTNAQQSDAEASSKFINQIEGIHTAQKVEVALMPKGLLFRSTFTERVLRQSGCTFITRDPSRIAVIIDLLKRANVRPGVRAFFGAWSPRAAVYLTLAKGREIAFVFDQPSGDSPVAGSFSVRGEVPRSVIADSSLPQKLFAWGEAVGAVRNNVSCVSLARAYKAGGTNQSN